MPTRPTAGATTLADQSYTLVTDNFTGADVQRHVARVVDLNTGGMLRGTCVLGDFTPYRTARRLLALEQSVEPLAIDLADDVAADLERRGELFILDREGARRRR